MRRLFPLRYTLSTSLLCYGFVLFLFGPCLTAIAQTFGVPLGHAGLLFTLSSAGLIPSVLAIGFLSEVLGKRRVPIASALTMAAGYALFAGVASTAGLTTAMVIPPALTAAVAAAYLVALSR